MKNLFKSHDKKSGANSHLSWRHYSTDTFIYSTGKTLNFISNMRMTIDELTTN